MPARATRPSPTSPPSSLDPARAAMHLYLVRHGEVEARYHRVFGGKIDMNLSLRGRAQARALARHLCKLNLDAIYASPMQRVQQTMAPLLRHRKESAVILPALREVDFGDWTGLHFTQVLDRFGVPAWRWLEHLEAGTVPGGEDAGALQRRIGPCLRRIVRRHAGHSVAVVCHGGVIRVILSLLLEMPLSKMSMFEVDYASLTWIEIQPHRVEVQLLNFAPWRDSP